MDSPSSSVALNRVGDNYVTFSLNRKLQKVSGLPGGTTLLQYIRDHAQLKGTKYMCREGGCGACIVNLTFTNSATHLETSVGVNSCLFAVYSCQGMVVTTVEGIGSRQKGYHPVQTRLAQFYGTQCGFCTPGWVMAMYSLLKSDHSLTMKQIEESFASNNCRCTGYRPILDAFKSFAEDSTEELQNKITDIEDLLKECKKGTDHCREECKVHKNCKERCNEYEEEEEDLEKYFVELALSAPRLCVHTEDTGRWYKVASVQEIFEIFTMLDSTYMLVGGNTAQGVRSDKYPIPPDVYIDINGVAELKSHRFEAGYLILGANMTPTETINLFLAVSKEKPSAFGYLEVLARHMTKIAHIPVRNVGTLAGNLSTKHTYPEFPSDLFTIYEAVGAQLEIESEDGSQHPVSFLEYLETNMYKKVITNIIFQPLDKTYIVKTYKIARRAQNDHAAVNAGFCFSVDKSDGYKVLRRPSIVYGGIKPTFIHAVRTESYLEGTKLVNNYTLQKALSILNLEVAPDRVLPESSEEYRKGLAFSLFYRYVLSLNSSAVNRRFQSGGEDITRPLSSGKQEYYSDPHEYPLTQPLPKLESLIQCSGEIEYTNDVPTAKTELFASLVLADSPPAILDSIDPKEALHISGVVAFFSAKDIPGVNTFISVLTNFTEEYEELFASKEIQYSGQPVGVVIACSQETADFAAQRVCIKYKNIRKPFLYIQQVLKSGEKKRLKLRGSISPTKEKADVAYKIKGDFSYKGQYHYYYENQTCVVRPVDNNNLDVIVSTQWVTGLQEALTLMLNISENRINIQVRRCGGAYGGKISRSHLPACACALSAYLLQRPVRIMMNLEANMQGLGGRYLMYSNYEVGVNADGVVQYLKAQCYTDKGVSFNDSVTKDLTLPSMTNIYDNSTWNVDFYDVKTDKPSTTLARAPGTLEGVGVIEHIMEHIAWTVKKDPMTVRLSNTATGSPMPQYIADLTMRSDYKSRLVKCRAFNASNQWKKRGISMVPMRFPANFLGAFYALVSVYRLDGTVAISHGGTELGQGINTKIAQIAAHSLGIPLQYIQIKSTNNLSSPNNFFTASSAATDSAGFAVKKCCEELNKRLLPVRKSLGKDVAWDALIQAAYALNINLNTTFMFVPERDLKNYSLFGLTVLEIEIDCLTGEHKILQVDILQNIGQSINPFVDIGQIEGAFLMGIGHFTCEELIYNLNTGHLTTDRTWEYKIPGAKDIPVDWRIYFRKDPDTSPTGLYGSKTVAEAPLVMSISVLFAIRRAIESVRRDIGLPMTFFYNDPPCTIENIFLRCKTKFQDYML